MQAYVIRTAKALGAESRSIFKKGEIFRNPQKETLIFAKVRIQRGRDAMHAILLAYA